MAPTIPVRQKPGRKPSIAAHPACAEIELARAAGDSLATIAARFQVGRASIDRHWRALPPERRARLAELAAELRQYEARIRTAFADLAARPKLPTAAACRRMIAESMGRSRDTRRSEADLHRPAAASRLTRRATQ